MARLPGRSVRTTSQAASPPIATQAAVTAAASPTLRSSRSPVRGLAATATNAGRPPSSARTAR
jgi:hypothetical protein